MGFLITKIHIAGGILFLLSFLIMSSCNNNSNANKSLEKNIGLPCNLKIILPTITPYIMKQISS